MEAGKKQTRVESENPLGINGSKNKVFYQTTMKSWCGDCGGSAGAAVRRVLECNPCVKTKELGKLSLILKTT